MKLSVLLSSLAAITLAAPTLKPRDNPLLYPSATFRHFINTGENIQDPQNQPLVLKNNVPADESSTIVTFNFDENLQGRRCKLLFDLWDRDVSTGSQQLDVFSVNNPPTSPFTTASITNENRPAWNRDQQRGRIMVKKPGTAEWIMSYSGWPEFDCPAGMVMGLEFVGVGDAVAVRWDIGVTGPRVQVLG